MKFVSERFIQAPGVQCVPSAGRAGFVGQCLGSSERERRMEVGMDDVCAERRGIKAGLVEC